MTKQSEDHNGSTGIQAVVASRITTDYPRDLFGARLNEYEVPVNPQQSECRSCGAAMVWTHTRRGASMPLSVATIEARDGIRYAMPHFVDCPEAQQWSKQR